MKLIFNIGLMMLDAFYDKELRDEYGELSDSIRNIEDFWEEYIPNEDIWRDFINAPYLLGTLKKVI